MVASCRRDALRVVLLLVSAVLMLMAHPTRRVAAAPLNNHFDSDRSDPGERAHVAHADVFRRARSFREYLLSPLKHPDVDVLLIVGGALLIYIELNVPGMVVPGAVGILVLLLGAFGLSQMPVRPWAVLLLAFATVPLVLAGRPPQRVSLAAVGTACLVGGFAFLVKARSSELGVHRVTAVCAGVVLGLASSWLAGVAFRARRNKRSMGSACTESIRRRQKSCT